MASKSKGKDKIKSPPPPIEVEPPTEKEVVPGKLSEKGWLDLLSRNDGTEVATELVNEVFEVSFSIVYSHYLEKQAFPHAISDAKHSLLQIIEWQFLSRDEGEKDTQSDPSWIEDEEPVPATIDSWARGVVPSASLSTLESPIDSLEPVRVQSSLQTEQDYIESNSTSPIVLTDRPGEGIPGSGLSSRRKSAPKQKPSKSTRPIARHPKARLVALQHPSNTELVEEIGGNKEQRETTPSLHSHTPTSFTEDTSHTHPLPYGMKPIQLTWQKEVSYDERGNIVDMVKLDPTKFPTHCVKPSVGLVKPPPQQSKHSTSTRKYTKSKQTLKPIKSVRGGSITKRRVETDVSGGLNGGVGERESRRFPELPTLPALVDTIDPVPGVTVKEAGRTVQGPTPHKSFSGPIAPHTKLRPLQQQDKQTTNSKQVKLDVTLSDKGHVGRGHMEVDNVISSSDRKVYVQVQ